MQDTSTYDAALALFLSYALSIQPEQHASFPVPVFTIEPGRKYDRIILANPHKSAFCFVRKSDGAVLKTANYKAPAKHPRGTIYLDDPSNVDAYGIGPYGANYLR